MASMKYHKDVKRWRVFWHITLPDGKVDKGSKSFKDKKSGSEFKEYIEKREKQLKNAIILEVPYFEELVIEWKQFLINRYTDRTKGLYEYCMDDFVDYLEGKVILCSDVSVNVVNSYINYCIGKGLANRTINNSLSVIKNFCNFAQENYNAAYSYLERCLEVGNQRNVITRVNFILGQINQMEGDLERATHYYNQTIKRNPEYRMAFEAKMNLASAGAM